MSLKINSYSLSSLMLYRPLLISFIASRILLFGFGYYFNSTGELQQHRIGEEMNFLNAFGYGWDSIHYVNIAKNGYGTNLPYYAFMPAYPALISLISNLPFIRGWAYAYQFSGFFISNFSFLITILLGINLLKNFYSPKQINYFFILLFVFPTSFFFNVAYTESLFLLMVIATFYFYYIKNNYLIAGLFCSIAVLTRIIGFGLMLGLIIDYVYRFLKGDEKAGRFEFGTKLLCLCLPVIVFTLYSGYLYLQTGDPLIFLHAQESPSWNRHISIPLISGIAYGVDLFIKTPALGSFMDLALPISFLVLLFVGRKSLEPGILLYSLFVIIIPLSTGTTLGISRFLITCLGPFLILAGLIEQRRKVSILIVLTSLIFLLSNTVRFTLGFFVA